MAQRITDYPDIMGEQDPGTEGLTPFAIVGDRVDLSVEPDPHAVAGLLKLFLRVILF